MDQITRGLDNPLSPKTKVLAPLAFFSERLHLLRHSSQLIYRHRDDIRTQIHTVPQRPVEDIRKISCKLNCYQRKLFCWTVHFFSQTSSLNLYHLHDSKTTLIAQLYCNLLPCRFSRAHTRLPKWNLLHEESREITKMGFYRENILCTNTPTITVSVTFSASQVRLHN